MNRHQSNPFLSEWDNEKDTSPGQPSGVFESQENKIISSDTQQAPSQITTRRYSSSQADITGNPFGAQRNADRRLYHRNMSSFEAASQLEFMQQRNGPNSDLGDDPTELIAKMTADFQSAIATSDQEFAIDTEGGESIVKNPFDPFETITDDDISIPSPAPNTATKSTTIPDNNVLNGRLIQDQQTENNHDTNGKNDKKLESNPDQMIDSSSRMIGTNEPGSFRKNEKSDADDAEFNRDCEDVNKKGPMFATPSAITEPKNQQFPTSDDIGGTDTIAVDKSVDQSMDDAPRAYFDPFKTVIEKDALTSLPVDIQNSSSKTQPEIGHEANPEEVKDLSTSKNNESSDILRTNRSIECKATPRPTVSAELRIDRNSDQAHAPQFDSSTSRLNTKRQNKTPKKKNSEESSDSDDDDNRIQIVIKAREASANQKSAGSAFVPLLQPPPSKSSMKQARERGQVEDVPSPVMSYKSRIKPKDSDSSAEENEDPKHLSSSAQEDKSTEGTNLEDADDDEKEEDDGEQAGQFIIPMPHSDDEGDAYAKPETPLYDEDTSYALEEFPAKYTGSGWEMMLRYPPKKKLTSNRFWKKIFVKLAEVPLVQDTKNIKHGNEADDGPQSCIALQIHDKSSDKKPMQEIPIQATYTVSDISSQQYDQFGKIFTIKLQYIFYKERVGVRQGQLARFIHSGHIGSSTTSGGHGVDPLSIGAIKRMGAPIEHSPQISQIIKLGCTDYNDIKQFKNCLEDHLFKIPIHRDRALTIYKTEEVQMAVRDDTYVEVNHIGNITKQLARVRLFFLSFLNGMPVVEVGINDIHRQGKEVVGRMDILPVVTEEWIRLEDWELHSTVDREEFEKGTRIIKLTPPDATFFELMRFRIRPPRNRELPLQISASMSVTRTKVSINCEVMVPGCVSRKHGQIPCENIAIRFYIPECWIYFFREEKHFRMGSKKSVNRRPGKVKGIERFLGGGGLQDINDESSLIEVTSGQAKYEHHHHAIVWRASRWPKESQSAYVQNTMKIRLPLTAYDKMPENFYEFFHVEYTMPATTVSHTTLRSISVNPCDDEPPEKYVKYSARYEYKVKMRLSINLGAKSNESQPDPSPIIIMKQPDVQDDLQREEDIDDSDESD